jgi:hypothetical protein
MLAAASAHDDAADVSGGRAGHLARCAHDPAGGGWEYRIVKRW